MATTARFQGCTVDPTAPAGGAFDLFTLSSYHPGP
jgi:hypothetical protein